MADELVQEVDQEVIAPGPFPDQIIFGESQYHPFYAANVANIRYWMAVFNGGAEAKTYLQKFEGETDEAFAKRRDETAFRRLSARALSVFASHIFAKPPQRDGLPEPIAPFINDIDGDGTDADQFFSQLYTNKSLPSGVSFILVTRSNTEVETKAQEQELGIRARALTFDAEQLLKWEMGQDGKLQYAVLSDTLYRSENFFDYHERCDILRVWTKNEWAVYERVESTAEIAIATKNISDSWELESWGQHNLGVVPIVPVYNIKEGPMQGKTEMGTLGLADLNLDIYTHKTWLDQGLKHGGFPITVLYLADGSTFSTMESGPGYGIKLNIDEKADILETTGTALGMLAADIERDKLELLDTAFRQLAPTKSGGGPEAADKKKLDMAQLSAVIREKALNVQEAERRVWELFCRWEGVEVPADEDSVIYSTQVAPEVYRATVDEIGKMYGQYQAIDRQTAIELWQSGGEWPMDLTWDEIEKRTMAQQQSAAAVMTKVQSAVAAQVKQ